MQQKAIFIDKDGTLIVNLPFNTNPLLITLMEGAGEALLQLAAAGYIVVIISNQPGIAYGYMQPSDIHLVHKKISGLLSNFNMTLAGFYYCPHAPGDACQCRKPSGGLLKKAALDLNINLAKSWMIGDILDDVEAGHNASCQSILLDNGNETLWEAGPRRKPDRICKHWSDIPPFILRTIELPDDYLKLPTSSHQLVSHWS